MLNFSKNIEIRTYHENDYEGALAVLKDCYEGIDDNFASKEDVQNLAVCFPTGQIVACIGNEVVGLIFSLFVRFDDFSKAPNLSDLYNPKLFTSFAEKGDSLFALEILVKSTHKRKGIGKMLNRRIDNILKINNLKAFIGVSRVSGYGALKDKMGIEIYIEKVVSGELHDPSLSFNCQNKMLPTMAIPDYYPPDIASAGFGAMVIQHNTNYMENQLIDFLENEQTLLKLPSEILISKEEIKIIVAELPATPFTFEYDNMPSCWGKAFENYLSMAEYHEPHKTDAKIANLSKPILEKLIALLEKEGLSVFPLHDNRFGKDFVLGDFRAAKNEAHQSILHVDDIKLDGKYKEDFELPSVLKDNDYVQLMLLLQLKDNGEDATLRIYDKKFQESDTQFLNENGWQFADEVIENTTFTDFVPKIGDAILMKNQYFHDVMGSEKMSEWCCFSAYILYVPSKKCAYLYI